MNEDQFARLFKYLNEEFRTIRNEIADTKSLVNTCVNAVDAFAKQTEIYHHEMLALGHQVDRHEQWIHKAAKTTHVKFAT